MEPGQNDDNDFDPMEHEVEILPKANQFNKKSPVSMTGSTRKGTNNLVNISNTVNGNNR